MIDAGLRSGSGQRQTHVTQLDSSNLRGSGSDLSSGLTRPQIAYNRDAMPLDFRDPFVFCVFSGALCGDRKNGKSRTVVPRLTLLRVGTNKSDDRHCGQTFLESPFSCPIFLGHTEARASASKASGCILGGTQRFMERNRESRSREAAGRRN